MRFQASYLSYILLAGIVISLATAAILWGQPLLTKNKIKTEVDLLQQKALELAEALEEATTKEVTVDFTGANGYIQATNGTIILTYYFQNTKNVIYTNINNLPINIAGNYTDFAIKGAEPMCVVNLTATPKEITFKIGCRRAIDPISKRCYEIYVKDFPTIDLRNKRILLKKVDEKTGSAPNCTVLIKYYIELSVT